MRLNRGRLLRTNLLEPSAAHRHWRGAWPGLPPLVGKASDLPRLQGLKHPPRHGTFAVRLIMSLSPCVNRKSQPIRTTLETRTHVLPCPPAELQRQAIRLWSRQEWPDRRRQPRQHPGHGHLRLRCARVRRHRYIYSIHKEKKRNTVPPPPSCVAIKSTVCTSFSIPYAYFHQTYTSSWVFIQGTCT